MFVCVGGGYVFECACVCVRVNVHVRVNIYIYIYIYILVTQEKRLPQDRVTCIQLSKRNDGEHASYSCDIKSLII